MNILNFIRQNTESEGSKEAGKFECTSSGLVKSVIGLVNKVGMLNPSALRSHSARGVSVTKKGDKYVIKLLMYNPPIEVTWTPLMNMEDLFDALDSLTKSRKKVGYLNFASLHNGEEMFQLALSK